MDKPPNSKARRREAKRLKRVYEKKIAEDFTKVVLNLLATTNPEEAINRLKRLISLKQRNPLQYEEEIL